MMQSYITKNLTQNSKLEIVQRIRQSFETWLDSRPEAEPPKPKFYTNSQGRELHTLFCECETCTIRHSTYRKAFN